LISLVVISSPEPTTAGTLIPENAWLTGISASSNALIVATPFVKQNMIVNAREAALRRGVDPLDPEYPDLEDFYPLSQI
jgi:hypothetical protein